MKTEITSFDNLEELYALIAKPFETNKGFSERIRSNEFAQGGNKKWFGVDGGIDEVETILKKGWSAGVNRMQECFADLKINAVQPISIKRRKIRTDSGDDYDWQAGAQGQHDTAWTRSSCRKVKSPRTVTLFCDLASATSWRTESDAFYWRGAATLFLADHLQSSGFNVKIIAGSRCKLATATSNHRQTNVTVKDSNMPLDLNSLATVLCLAGFYRTQILSASCAIEPTRISGNHGHSREVELESGQFLIAANTEESARAIIASTLALIQGE